MSGPPRFSDGGTSEPTSRLIERFRRAQTVAAGLREISGRLRSGHALSRDRSLWARSQLMEWRCILQDGKSSPGSRSVAQS